MNYIYYPEHEFNTLIQSTEVYTQKIRRLFEKPTVFLDGKFPFEEGVVMLGSAPLFTFRYTEYAGNEESEMGNYGFVITAMNSNDCAMVMYISFHQAMLNSEPYAGLYIEPISEEASKTFDKFSIEETISLYLYKFLIPLEEIQRKSLFYTKKIIRVKESVDRNFNENSTKCYKSKPINIQSGIKYQYVREYQNTRSYTKHIDTFNVRGHYRHYKNGKVVFIKPFKKGTGKSKDTRYIVGGE